VPCGKSDPPPAGFGTAEAIARLADSSRPLEDHLRDLALLVDASAADPSAIAAQLPYGELFRFHAEAEARATVDQILQNVASHGISAELAGAADCVLEAARKCDDAESAGLLQTILMAITELTQPRSADTVAYLLESLYRAQPQIQERILDGFIRLSTDPEFAKILIDQGPDMYRLLNTTHRGAIQSKILKLALVLLPGSRVLEPLGYPRSARSDRADEFAQKIQPQIVDVIVSSPGIPGLTLLTFAATLAAVPAQVSRQLAMCLITFATFPALAPYVLAVLTFLCRMDGWSQICARIIEELEKVSPPDPIRKWYDQGIAHLRSKKLTKQSDNYASMTMQDFTDAAASGRLCWFTFLTDGGIDQCVQLISGPQSDTDIRPLVAFCTDLLSLCPLPPNIGPRKVADCLSLLESATTIRITLESGQLVDVQAPLYAPVAFVEGLVNADAFDTAVLVRRMAADAQAQRILTINKELSPSQLSALHRGLSGDYPTLGLVNDARVYSVSDFVIGLVCDAYERRDSPLTFSAEQGQPQQYPKFRPFRSKFFDVLLQFLCTVSAELEINVENDQLISRVRESLQFPLNSIGRLSPTYALLFEYSELFPFGLRELAFKLSALDPLSAFALIVAEFHPEAADLLPRHIGLPITVDRANLAEDGAAILDQFAAHRVPLEITFAGEKGVGSGVRREFVAKLSGAYRERKDLWRRNQELGLFPAPTADPDAFEQIGVLVAKALTMDCLAELPFNPAFFSIVAGQDVGLSEVDPVLNRTIRLDPSGCELDFEYPGYPDVFARPGEVVTQQNQEEFVRAIEVASTQANVQECAKRFRQGFQRVMCYRSIGLFSNDEITRLIAGGPAKFECDEFIKGIELSGYTVDSPEITALADVLAELSDEAFGGFVKFVTGSKQLPSGGFAGLRPRMGVWRLERDGLAADDIFPMATVCLNVLRLPPYSTLVNLKEKLLVAIDAGGDAFFLP
jgi:hypothetical protein